MSLLRALHTEAGSQSRRVIAAAIIAGMASALLLVTVSKVVEAPGAGTVDTFVLYAACLVAYVSSARHTSHRVTELIESLIHRVKVQISEKVAQIELDGLERVNAAEICDRVTENSIIISDRAGDIATMLQSVVIITCAMMYLAWLLPPAFTVVLFVGVAGAWKFLDVRRDFITQVRQTFARRLTFLERMTDLVAGFKEVQFGRLRRQEIREHILQSSAALRAASIQSNNLFADGKLVADAILFITLAVVVYTLRRFILLDASTLTRVVAAVMFLWGPFMGLISGLMPYIRSNLAFSEMNALDAKLAEVARAGAPVPNPPENWKDGMKMLKVCGIE